MMKGISQKLIITFVLVLLSVVCFVIYLKHAEKQKMYEEFTTYLPDGYFNPDDPAFWRVAIKVSEQELRNMASPDYREKEQQRMKRLKFDITITDEMINERYKKTKNQLSFAKKELRRLSDE